MVVAQARISCRHELHTMIEGRKPDTPSGKTFTYAMTLAEDDHILTILLQLSPRLPVRPSQRQRSQVTFVLHALRRPFRVFHGYRLSSRARNCSACSVICCRCSAVIRARDMQGRAIRGLGLSRASFTIKKYQ